MKNFCRQLPTGMSVVLSFLCILRARTYKWRSLHDFLRLSRAGQKSYYGNVNILVLTETARARVINEDNVDTVCLTGHSQQHKSELTASDNAKKESKVRTTQTLTEDNIDQCKS